MTRRPSSTREVGIAQTETEGSLAESMIEGTVPDEDETGSAVPPTKLEGYEG